MKPEENPAVPSFWEALGITPIVIDDSTPGGIQVGLDQLTDLIEIEVTRIHLNNQLEDE